MAIIHVRIDVDSDVYPELYAMLEAIERAASRPERMRQLAANGLIWEHLRARPVQAPPDALMGVPQGAPALAAAPASAPVPSPTAAQVSSPAQVASPMPAAPVPSAAIAAPPKTLAAERAKAAAAPLRSVAPPGNVPVLYDAVEVAGAERRKGTAPAPTAPSPESAEPAVTTERRSGSRPRLMKMKEKGLFNNG
jgi:hypothetical protein